MILINLLPHREAKRQQRKTVFFAGLGAAAGAGALIAGLWWVTVNQSIANQQERNEFIAAENRRLDEQIKDIANIKAEIDALKARQKAVEDLQTDRNVPVYMLNELADLTPEGIYYTALKQTDKKVDLTGVAQTNERVSELLRSLSRRAQWLKSPELVEIKAVTVPGAKGGRRLYDFSIRLTVQTPTDAAASQSPASGASAPAAPAPGAAASAPAPAPAAANEPKKA